MSKSVPPSRRQFLGKVGGATAATLAVGAIGLEPLIGTQGSTAQATAVGQGSNQRTNQCEKIRKDAAQANKQAASPNLQHPTNPDDDLYPNKIGSYSKGLPHNNDGTVVLSAYNSLVSALSSGRPADFDAIPMGGDRKLTSPQSGYAFDMEGADAHSFVQPPAPAFSSREEGAEIAENYWMAIMRDIPFTDYGNSQVGADAASDLNLFGADFKGAKTDVGSGSNNGVVNPNLLFRGLTPGDKAGPLMSQFWYLPCFFGANQIDQQIVTVRSIADGGADYMTSYNTGPGNYLDIQRGISPPFGDRIDPVRRYMRSGRDLGQWVHIDVLFQGYFQAFLVIASLGVPVDNGNPYRNNPTQAGFATFGGPHIATLLCEVATRALKAVWYQKWLVHRRLRPENFAARIHRTLNDGAGYPINSEILNSVSSATRLGEYLPAGNALLPMAFPEGCPTHPAYGAGHATVAGACVTILKAWFKESTRIVDLTTPVVPTTDGQGLLTYTGADAAQMTVGGELNKIASNVALGRNMAGVHWRSDATESLKLGEAVALSILKDQRGCYNETFNGFSLTKFDGTTVTV